MVFSWKMEPKWSPGGGPNADKNDRISWTFRHPLPGALQGRVWRGLWVDLGRIFGGFWKYLAWFSMDFEWNLGRFSIEFSKEGLGMVLDGFGKDFGRVLNGFGMILGGFWKKVGKVFDWIFEGFLIEICSDQVQVVWRAQLGGASERAQRSTQGFKKALIPADPRGRILADLSISRSEQT